MNQPATGNHVHLGDNLEVLRRLPDASFALIYIDPPFNTGREQSRTRIRTVQDEAGDRIGFKGKAYRTITVGTRSYADSFDDYLGFLEPRLVEARRLLAADGVFFFHIDYREVHYCKILLDGIFGRESFLNELIWAYDYGARSKSKWPAKHDNILVYVKDPEHYVFDLAACDRIPYMAPGLVGAEKAARGKTPTDVWWHTIVSPTGREKTGYPTQKPLGIMRRIISVHSRPGDAVLDFFAGSGSTGVAAVELGRTCTLVDSNPEAVAVIKMRLAGQPVTWHGCEHIAAAPADGYAAPPPEAPVEAEPPAAAAPAAGPVAPRAAAAPAARSALHRALDAALQAKGWSVPRLATALAVSPPTAYKLVGGSVPRRSAILERLRTEVLGLGKPEFDALLAGDGAGPAGTAIQLGVFA